MTYDTSFWSYWIQTERFSKRSCVTKMIITLAPRCLRRSTSNDTNEQFSRAFFIATPIFCLFSKISFVVLSWDENRFCFHDNFVISALQHQIWVCFSMISDWCKVLHVFFFPYGCKKNPHYVMYNFSLQLVYCICWKIWTFFFLNINNIIQIYNCLPPTPVHVKTFPY